jgi:hypothetical protein
MLPTGCRDPVSRLLVEFISRQIPPAEYTCDWR